MEGLEWITAGGAGVATAAVIYLVVVQMPKEREAFQATLTAMIKAHTEVEKATREAFAERSQADRAAIEKIVESINAGTSVTATLVESIRAAQQWDGKERRGRQHVQAKEHPDERKPT